MNTKKSTLSANTCYQISSDYRHTKIHLIDFIHSVCYDTNKLTTSAFNRVQINLKSDPPTYFSHYEKENHKLYMFNIHIYMYMCLWVYEYFTTMHLLYQCATKCEIVMNLPISVLAYCIRSIRCRGYYLFCSPILCAAYI